MSDPAGRIVEYAGPGVESAQPKYYGLTAAAWMRIALISATLVALFWPNLRRLWYKTNPFTGEPNWQHSIFVPLIGLYYLYLNREQLLKAKTQTSWTGLPILLFGLFLFAYGIWPGQNDFVKDFAMVATLFGVVLLICGWDVMKTAWFPILFLVCAIPWPQLVYSWVALPLQKLAATAAVVTLQLTGVDASQSGTKLTIGTGRVLNVAEACAGLKSLMTFVAVGAAIGFLSSRALWQKLLISVSAVPIAIFCNMMRVAGQGLLDHYVDRRLSESFAHQFVGMIMLIPAFFLIQGVAWVLDNLFIEEVDRHKVEARARKAAAAGAAVKTAAPRPQPPAPIEDEMAAAARRLASARLKRRANDAVAAPAGRSTQEAEQ